MISLYSMHFMQGQKDCMAGKIHESGRSEAYNTGYAAQELLYRNNKELGIG